MNAAARIDPKWERADLFWSILAMTPEQRIWVQSKNRLARALVAQGFPEELSALLARQLKSPRAMDRMTAYLCQAHPGSIEMIADEMLAICADTEAWREKIRSRKAQEGYSAWLNSEERWMNAEDDPDA